MKTSFISQEAVLLFEYYTGFRFHVTVPGQLMARRGVKKIPVKSKPTEWDSDNWRLLWNDMVVLALERSRYLKLAPPRDSAVPDIDYFRQAKKDTAAGKTGPDLLPHPTRQFINTPFNQKDDAKALGAKWDPGYQMWYVPTGKDRHKFPWPDVLLPGFLRGPDLPGKPTSMASIRATQRRGPPAEIESGSLRSLHVESKARLRYLLEETPDR